MTYLWGLTDLETEKVLFVTSDIEDAGDEIAQQYPVLGHVLYYFVDRDLNGGSIVSILFEDSTGKLRSKIFKGRFEFQQSILYNTGVKPGKSDF